MPVNYISFAEAKTNDGIRMVVNQAIPSPWSEAAKGILHIKMIPWSGVYFDPRNMELHQWTGIATAPALKVNGHDFISDWQDILNFAEGHEASPRLLPEGEEEKAKVLEISQLICGKNGLGWTRRLNNVHRSFTNGDDAFPEFIAKYMAKKYGYEREEGPHYGTYTVNALNTLSARLKSQKERGSRFYVGDSLTAADIYSATFMGILKPLPEELCKMDKMVRAVFSSMDEQVSSALDPILLEHRDFIYQEFLELPLSL